MVFNKKALNLIFILNQKYIFFFLNLIIKFIFFILLEIQKKIDEVSFIESPKLKKEICNEFIIL